MHTKQYAAAMPKMIDIEEGYTSILSSIVMTVASTNAIRVESVEIIMDQPDYYHFICTLLYA